MFENDREALGGDSGFRQIGFLLLLDEGWKTAGDQILEMESTHGVEVRELSREDIRELAPPLNLEGIVRAIFEPRSGCADPIRTTESLVNGARQWGLTAHVGVAATGITLDGGRVRSVETEQGTIETPVVVNAAGPWGRQVGLWAGLNYSVRWSRETDLIVTQPDDFGPLPVISDPPQTSLLQTPRRPHDAGRTRLPQRGGAVGHRFLQRGSGSRISAGGSRACLFRRIPVNFGRWNTTTDTRPSIRSWTTGIRWWDRNPIIEGYYRILRRQRPRLQDRAAAGGSAGGRDRGVKNPRSTFTSFGRPASWKGRSSPRPGEAGTGLKRTKPPKGNDGTR